MRFLLFILVLSCSGCFTEKRAQRQFNKVADAFPEIPTEYCAEKYPVREVTIKGDSIVTFDTIYVGGEIEYKDSIINDTVYLTKLVTKQVTKTVTITDTIFRENKAALDVARHQINRLTKLLESTVEEKNKFKNRAKYYIWIIVALSALLIASNYSRFKKFLPVLLIFMISCSPSKRNTLPVYIPKEIKK